MNADLAYQLQSLPHLRNMASLLLFYKYLHCIASEEVS